MIIVSEYVDVREVEISILKPQLSDRIFYLVLSDLLLDPRVQGGRRRGRRGLLSSQTRGGGNERKRD